MNPIKNKKDLEATIDDIRKYAYSYLEKYSPSKQQLKTYLLKKIVKKGHKISDKRGLMDLINEVVLTLENQKFINDKFYSDTKSKSSSLLRKALFQYSGSIISNIILI